MNIDIEKLKEMLNKSIVKANEPMNKHTTFGIGGLADIFIECKDIEELEKIVKFANKENIPFYVIGNGSNILVTDKGIRGITIKIDFDNIEILDNNRVKADAGVKNGYFGQFLLKNELSGYEEISGIPGTVGGSVRMNAGAFGKEIKDIVKEVVVLEDGEIKKYSRDELNFSYRYTEFAQKNSIVLSAVFQFEHKDRNEIENRMKECLESRIKNQPLEFPSAGSTFKRGNDFITSKLIDEAGLKGYSIGGAQISTKHAGFIVNYNNATAQDVIDLIEYAQKVVKEKFQKDIFTEIEIIGEK